MRLILKCFLCDNCEVLVASSNFNSCFFPLCILQGSGSLVDKHYTAATSVYISVLYFTNEASFMGDAMETFP